VVVEAVTVIVGQIALVPEEAAAVATEEAILLVALLLV
jgi:hypothetical protein